MTSTSAPPACAPSATCCKKALARSNGTVAVKRGDALVLTGNYTIDHAAAAGTVVVGQALVDCDRNSAAIPVRVRGVCEFAYTGTAHV